MKMKKKNELVHSCVLGWLAGCDKNVNTGISVGSVSVSDTLCIMALVA